MKPLFPALLLCAGILAGCGGAEDSYSLEVSAGELVTVDLEGEPSGEPALPDGAVIEGGRLTWTPSPEHIGEHRLALDVIREDGVHAVEIAVVVGDANAAGPLTYGGCECGSLPQPPRPRGDAPAALLGLAAWAWRRRAAVRA